MVVVGAIVVAVTSGIASSDEITTTVAGVAAATSGIASSEDEIATIAVGDEDCGVFVVAVAGISSTTIDGNDDDDDDDGEVFSSGGGGGLDRRCVI